jgi:3-hydroxyisobutyrate dehydrogenase-like beta-hydroxyacid dehydrogenase
MGAAMSQRLRQSGFDVFSWDRRKEANEALS